MVCYMVICLVMEVFVINYGFNFEVIGVGGGFFIG